MRRLPGPGTLNACERSDASDLPLDGGCLRLDPLWRTHLVVSAADWLLLGLLGWGAVRWLGIDWWVPAVVVGAWMLKDLLVFPASRWYYEAQPPQRRMLGATGRAVSDLSPDGFVQVRGEIWRARAHGDAARIRQGEPVRVCAAEGLQLLVELSDPAAGAVSGTHREAPRYRRGGGR